MAQAFEAQNPTSRSTSRSSTGPHVDDKVAALAKAGKAPDIAQTGSYADYAAAGQLYSADELFPISMQANFLPTAGQRGHRQPRAVRPTLGLQLAAVLLQQEALQGGGHQARPRDLGRGHGRRDQAAQERRREHPVRAAARPEEAQAESLMWMLGASGGYTDTVGSYNFDSAANISAFSWLKNNLVAPRPHRPGRPRQDQPAERVRRSSSPARPE